MAKLINSRMVAAQAGVAHSTVCRVFNRDSRITKETAQKVFIAARKLGYRPQSKRFTIGVALPLPKFDCYTSSAFSAILAELLRRQWICELIPNGDLSVIGDRYLSAGISLVGSDFSQQWNEYDNLPLISFSSRNSIANNVYAVLHDGLRDLKLVIGYLYKKGHRKIGMIMNHSAEQEREMMSNRAEGFIRTISSFGATDPTRYLLFSNEGTTGEKLEKLLQLGVTAILALPGDYALELLQEIRKRGLKVPDDISFISWEYPYVSELQMPPLTTLSSNFEKFAYTACEIIEKLCARQPVAAITRIGGHIIERDSVLTL